ncbi:hypothetical protein R2R35_24100 [Anaerocolumna sp. AGMB13020]|uniref:radical SAM protein n=1 Tax=Anaerocolumna sp. AGMB13020 TaxID=3081750 RepID=UPI002954EE2A|nr:radical SAM protein [Anaerocolumna sp. AGMB13020]WOO36835.1 hypothetical protein R2R35_24100 [Anaerocolumna sp. AGMB13020]
MNEHEFKIKYSIGGNHNGLLNQITKELRQKRPRVPVDLTYTLFEVNDFAQLWLQTKGCSFSKTGSCTCCDYWEGENLPNIAEVFKEALDKLSPNVSSVLIETSGSVFDDNEIPLKELKKIFELLDKKKYKKIVIETHMNTITRQKLDILKEIITGSEVCIEVGIESLSREVLLYSLNKMTVAKDITQLCEMVHEKGFKLIGNIMVGVPFLPLSSQIEDAVYGIHKLFEQGIDYIILFPVNIKQYTLVHWLYQNELYERVYGQAVIKVLNQIDRSLLDRIDVVWYGNRKQENPAYGSDILGPYYCEECSEDIMDFLQKFNSQNDLEGRLNLLDGINDYSCECKKSMENTLENEAMQKPDIYDLLDRYYEKMESYISK